MIQLLSNKPRKEKNDASLPNIWRSLKALMLFVSLAINEIDCNLNLHLNCIGV